MLTVLYTWNQYNIVCQPCFNLKRQRKNNQKSSLVFKIPCKWPNRTEMRMQSMQEIDWNWLAKHCMYKDEVSTGTLSFCLVLQFPAVGAIKTPRVPGDLSHIHIIFQVNIYYNECPQAWILMHLSSASPQKTHSFSGWWTLCRFTPVLQQYVWGSGKRCLVPG